MNKSHNKLIVLGRWSTMMGSLRKIFNVKLQKRINTPYNSHQYAALLVSKEGKDKMWFVSQYGNPKNELLPHLIDYRGCVYASCFLGATHVIGLSSVGALSTDWRLGDIVLVEDLIDLWSYQPTTFLSPTDSAFIRVEPIFCPTLRNTIWKTTREMRSDLKIHYGGVYGKTSGPRLETKAEVKALRTLGVDLVGMTISPEAHLYREAGICYMALAFIVNYAEGIIPYKKGSELCGLIPRGITYNADETRIDVSKMLLKISSTFRERNVPNCDICSEALKDPISEGRVTTKWLINNRKRGEKHG